MNTTTKAQRTNKRQDAIWEKAKRASEMTDEEHEQLEARRKHGAKGTAYLPPADKSAHTNPTPGPWRVVSCSDEHDRKRFSSIVSDSPTNRNFPFVAQVTRLSDTDETPEAQANARLIAAAPDLLAALREARAILAPLVHKMNVREHFSEKNILANVIDKAIQKAEGSAQ